MTFRENLRELFDSVMDPVWRRVRVMAWPFRASALALIACGVALFQFPSLRTSALSYFKQPSVSTTDTASGGEVAVPGLGPAMQIRDKLATMVASEILMSDSASQTAWSLAQATISVKMNENSQIPTQPDILAQIRNTKRPDKFCWSELFNSEESPCALFISGWVLTAYAKTAQPVTGADIDSLLSMQSREGAWSTFEDTLSDQYLSTYATSWNLIGLHSVRQQNLIPPDKVADVEKAISRAAAWLLRNQQQAARWKTYPMRSSGLVSLSASGLALHALHLTNTFNLRELDNQWLDALPENGSTLSNDEPSYVEIQTSRGKVIDHFLQFRIPWMIVATLDSIKNGDVDSVRQGRSFVFSALSNDAVVKAETHQYPWWRAEILYALEYLKDRQAEIE